tara:strand:- start:1892 stop:2086 length:195 start_codon:yes stop_codon:yes gene_type:complete
MDEAVFYPQHGKILINAYFYSFWISPKEFKKYNLEYKIVHSKYNSKNIETCLTKLEDRTRKIKI